MLCRVCTEIGMQIGGQGVDILDLARVNHEYTNSALSVAL